ncbi:MAG: chlorite dismutase family protein [bacterium]|nr:chlorite dismutase family protein [bacterium]
MIQKKTAEDQGDSASKINISEMGRTPDGKTISSDRRLFMQLQAWGEAKKTEPLIADLEAGNIHGVLYEDINDPTGVALLTFSENPDYFIADVREFLKGSHFSDLTPKPEYTMLGRSYAMGYESDLDETLISKPRSRVCNPEYEWAIWYPLRRAGSFEKLSAKEQRTILMEHGGVGRAFGKAGYVFDVRLSCHGLDKNDNDFVIGLIGPDLFPLSAIVERMRKTQQTSLHLQCLGPFFIGKVAWQTKKAG